MASALDEWVWAKAQLKDPADVGGENLAEAAVVPGPGKQRTELGYIGQGD